MTKPAPPIVLTRCEACHTRFLPTDTPCPKCGSTETTPYPVPGVGRVTAATELTNPAPGWTAPHRLALFSVADGVRVLAVVDGPLPALGDTLHLRLDGETYHAHSGSGAPGERGEGEFPKTRRHGPSFEPPR